jgi:dihydroneopterin aldolase
MNYEDLYEIIRSEMKKPSRLLENVGNRIIKSVFDQFPLVSSIEVIISKFNPPIGGICRRAYVTMSKKREDDI